jgi:DMSO/TMAO reductase YedYZ heme-binding membrane subunit
VETLTWDLARASGFVAYGLVTLAVAEGLALSLRWQGRAWPRVVNQALHEYLIVLAGVFTLVHGVMIWIDPFTRFTLAEVLVPGVSHYRPLWMAFGIVAAYIGLAVALSVFLRPRLGYAWWRRLHYLAYLVWLLATVHGLGDGSDTRTVWGLAIYAGATTLVLGLTVWRLVAPPGRTASGRPGLAMAAVGAAGGLALFTAWGPLRPDWNLIANNGHGSGAATTPLAASPDWAVGTTLGFDGTYTIQGGVLTVAGVLDGNRLTVALDLGPVGVGGTTITGGSARLRAGGRVWAGPVTAVDGALQLRLATAGGRTLTAAFALQPAGPGQLAGTLRILAAS